jgi:hypothetical protein
MPTDSRLNLRPCCSRFSHPGAADTRGPFATLALAALHARVLLVDHVNTAAATDHAAILVADLGGTQAVTDSHDARYLSWISKMGADPEAR